MGQPAERVWDDLVMTALLLFRISRIRVNYAGQRNEFTGRNGMAFIDSRHLWAVINAARKADGEVNP